MPEHRDIVIEDALDGLWAAIRGRHPQLPAVPVRVLDLAKHLGLFVPLGPGESAMIYVDRGLVDVDRWCTISTATIAQAALQTLLHEAAHAWLYQRGAALLASGARTYHSPLFRDAAEMLGLAPPKEPDEHRGYANCVLTSDTTDTYADALRQFREAVAA